MAGIPDLVKLVADLAAYEAAVAAGKTSPDVMYLILAEKQVYFQGALWSKAPDEGGGGGSASIATKDDLIEDEHVAAKSLNELKTNITEISEACASNKANIAALLTSLQSLIHNIEETEHVTASALIDLNSRIL